MMNRVLTLREIRRITNSSWELSISDSLTGEKWLCQVHDPLTNSLEKSEAGIRWALEDHPTRAPYDTAAARLVTKAINNYGIDLARQLGFQSPDGSPLINSEDPIIVDVIDHDISSRFHGIHWETLEAALSASGLQTIVRHSVTTSGPIPTLLNRNSVPRLGVDQIQVDRKRSLNILLVVSRPFKSTDVNPLIGIEALLAARDAAKGSEGGPSVVVNIEISRPGTWLAFTNLVERRSRDWKESGGRGPWYDIVHFDCHGVVRDGKPSLLFLSQSGTKALRRSAQDIAKCLTDHSIRFVVLHACNTAEVDDAGTSNLARLLLDSGLSAVIGMKYAFTSSAARIFIKTFYTTLFSSPELDFITAIGKGRTALRSDTVRLSRAATAVDLTDFIIPVLYYRDTTIVLNEDIHENHAIDGAANGMAASSFKPWPVKDIDALVTPIGREQDVLELEWLLLRSVEHKVAALNGCVGVGKTALAKFAGKWWTATESIAKVHYWDLKRKALPSCLDDLVPLLSGNAQPSPRRPDLLILDHIDAVMHNFSVFQDPLSDSERSKLLEWIHSKPGEHLRILLVSRSQGNWFGVPKMQQYRLKGLTDHDAFEHAMQQMSNLSPFVQSMGGHRGFMEWNNDYMGYLVSRLNHNPLSIAAFLDAIGKDRQITLNLTRTDHMNTHWAGLYPEGQQSLYNSILRGFVPLDPDNEWVQETEHLVDVLFKFGLSHGSAFALLAIAIPANTYREEWHRMICHDLDLELPGLIDHWNDAISDLCGIEARAHGPFGKSKIDEFLSLCLTDTGWIDTSEIIFADGTGERYYHIHPLLTNQLRRALLAGRYASTLPSHLYRKHAEYTAIWLNKINNMDQRMSQLYQVKAEHLNLLAACDTELAWCSKEQPPGFPKTSRQSAQFMAYQLCKDTVRLTQKLDIPSFAMDPAYTRVHALKDHLSTNVKEIISFSWPDQTLTSLGMLMELYLLVCDYQASYNPIDAGVTASTCLVIIMSVCETAQWNPISRLLLAKLLLFRAYGCYLARTRSAEARQAFEMAIRCRFQEASIKSALAATFLRKSPLGIFKSTARSLLALESSPCSPLIYADVCEHRLAAFSGLLHNAKDLTYFYGIPDHDSIHRRPAIIESVKFWKQSARVRDESTSSVEKPRSEALFPMQTLRRWIHEVVDDDFNPLDNLYSGRNDDADRETGDLARAHIYWELMSNIDQAMLDQDRLKEIEQRHELVQMAISNRNWEAAAAHILRIMDVERSRSGLPNLDARNTISNKMQHDSPGPPLAAKEGNLRQQQFQAASYGSVFLRLDDFEHAYFFFQHVRVLRLGNIKATLNFCESWEHVVDTVIDDIRTGIFILASPSVIVPKKGQQTPVTPEQAEQLDDLMQAMIIRCIQDKTLRVTFDFQESDRPRLHAMVKSPFSWKDHRTAAFCKLGLVHLMLHFDNLVHLDPHAVEKRRIKNWLAAYPKRELDLSPLEDGVPLSPVDPEGLYQGSLKHDFESYENMRSTQEVIDHNLGVRGASPEQMKLIGSLFPKGKI